MFGAVVNAALSSVSLSDGISLQVTKIKSLTSRRDFCSLRKRSLLKRRLTTVLHYFMAPREKLEGYLFFFGAGSSTADKSSHSP